MRIMTLLIKALAVFVGTGILLVSTVSATEASQLKVGAVKIDITPDDLTGMNPIGGRTYDRVHDPISMRVLVLQNEEESAALISLDLIEVGEMTLIRNRIEQELGIPADNIIVSATHNHSAPRIADVSPGAMAHAGTKESLEYTEEIYDQMIDALKQAQESAVPARFAVEAGYADVNINRDEFDGESWGLGRNESRPSDKTVWVSKFESLQGKTLAVIFNYAVHSVVTFGLNEISSDLAGATSVFIEENYGDDLVAIFTPGAMGDQNPRVFLSPNERNAENGKALAYDALDAQRTMLASEVMRVARNMDDLESDVKIAGAHRSFACPTKAGVDMLESMKQDLVENVNIQLSLLMLNQVAYGGVSGEVVTNIYDHLRRESPLSKTMVISIANDRIGYIADDAAYDQPLFEVNGSPSQRGCAEEGIVNGLVEMMKENL